MKIYGTRGMVDLVIAEQKMPNNKQEIIKEKNNLILLFFL
jgi:hypothetical protein